MQTYPIEDVNPTKIKVVGVGGGGCNAVDRMVAAALRGVEFLAVNTDAQALGASQAGTQLCIGQLATRGLGSGGNPVLGQQAAEESHAELERHLAGADMVCIAAGLGGGTGTGAAPVVAEAARELGALTVAVVTRPFGFEGRYRQGIAEQGLAQLRAVADTVVVIPNDRLLQLSARDTSITRAFQMADGVLRHGVQGIADVIVQHGLINVDFGDVRAIMGQAGPALMAIGVGSGNNRALDAVRRAIHSPLLDVGIQGARGVLFNITGGEDLGLLEVHEAADLIAQAVDPDANIIFGAVIDPHMPLRQVKVTLIATGFASAQSTPRKRFHPAAERLEPAPVPTPVAPPPPRTPLATGGGLMERPVVLQAEPTPTPPASYDLPPFLLRDRGARR